MHVLLSIYLWCLCRSWSGTLVHPDLLRSLSIHIIEEEF